VPEIEVDGANEAVQHGSGVRSIGGVAAVLVAVVLVISAAIGLRLVRSPEPDPLCAGLGGRVAGLDIVRWDNGFGASGPSWLAALTNGVAHGDAATRQAIAATVAADAAGFEQMVAGLGPTDRAAFDRLRLAATHPDQVAPADDPEIASAIATVRSLAGSRCNLV
jgi:hypothetical protein